ncbi:MAG: Obg family GTPase CgtA, partial [Solirubrobacterales bacterium]|nr:Obg family GTPase CgtA [Solirubrobacterales bacterium]
ALSKADLVDAATGERARERWSKRLGGVPVFVTSAATGAGLSELAAELVRRVPPADREERRPAGPDGTPTEIVADLAEHRVFRPAAQRSYQVQRTGEGSYRVTGAGIERLVARYDLDNEEALAHLERRLRGIGVLRALEAEGFRAGDEVEIAGVAFELDPEV